MWGPPAKAITILEAERVANRAVGILESGPDRGSIDHGRALTKLIQLGIVRGDVADMRKRYAEAVVILRPLQCVWDYANVLEWMGSSFVPRICSRGPGPAPRGRRDTQESDRN